MISNVGRVQNQCGVTISYLKSRTVIFWITSIITSQNFILDTVKTGANGSNPIGTLL